ncbi:S1 RNA-binding domain-containing protein, partial [bacterium]
GKRWSEKKRKHFDILLPEIAFHSSRTEKVADEAEREVVDAMRVWFMKERVGEEYEGTVIDITPYGLKVQLREFFIRGFLHVSYLTDDYYRFDEGKYRLVGRHKRKTFTIGKRIRVRIERVDIDEREIVLALA